MWEAETGVPPPAKVAHLRPIDGNWLNLEFKNWEIVSLKQTRLEQAQRKRGNSLKQFCTKCEAYLDRDLFPKHRTVCKKCYAEYLRALSNARYQHVKEYRCVILAGRHYHLTDRNTILEYWLRQYYEEMRKKSKDGSDFRVKVGRTIALFQRAVYLQGMEDRDDN